MAGDWIAMRVGLEDELEVVALSSRFERDTLWTIGALHVIWSIADQNSIDGRLIGYTCRYLDRRVGCDGFAQAMIDVGWLTQTQEGLQIPHFEVWFGPTSKRRLQNTKRQQRRDRSATEARQQRDNSATTGATTLDMRHKTDLNPPNPPLQAKGGTEGGLETTGRKRRQPKPTLAELAAAMVEAET